ncbi:hypothetical protein N9Z27_01380 [Alphaproteobacteria bacterium]|nr:hypothetical protein [Alphaproteobacteria bacterium]
MRFTITCLAIAIAFATTKKANAESFFDRLNNTIETVNSTIDQVDNAESTAGRITDKIPESKQPEQQQERIIYNERPQQRQRQQERIIYNQSPNAATTAEEERILREAKRIEEQRILDRAAEIKRKQSAASTSSYNRNSDY